MHEAKSVDEAVKRLLAQAAPVKEAEQVSWQVLNGRVLASDIRAPRDVPAFNASKMDGIAIAVDDWQQHQCDAVQMPISQRITAGMTPAPLQTGSAVRIFTGAPLPVGADTVIPQELCDFDGDTVQVKASSIDARRFVRMRGSDVAADDVVLGEGTRLNARHVAQITSLGFGRCPVYKTPRIGILSTGDEVLEPGQEYAGGAVYDANRPLLMSLFNEMGQSAVDLGCVGDSPGALRDVLAAGPPLDMIVLSGGMSVGEEDHVKRTVQSLGHLDFWRVNVKPGRPFAFGAVSRNDVQTPFFGLPGNPAAVLVTFLLFVRPFLIKASGRNDCQIPWQQACLRHDLSANQRETYLRVQWEAGEVFIHPNQDSGAVSSLAHSSGLLRVPAQQTINAGDTLSYVDYRSLLW